MKPEEPSSNPAEDTTRSARDTDKLRVAIADDHAVLREGVAALIEREADMCIVGQAGTGREAVRIAREQRPDIMVLDLSMPDLGGAQAAELLRSACPDVRIVVLTRHADAGYLQKMWRLGARGYVLKRAVVADLVKALRAVGRGNTYIDPDLADQFREGVLGRARHATGSTITGRETDVLKLVAWGYSNAEVARRLGISVKTVEFYRACAVEKLNLHGRSEIVRYAIQQGWINDDATPERGT